MGAAPEDKTSPSKNLQKTSLEGRNTKVVKKSRDKKTLKGLDADAVIEAIESNSPESEDLQDGRDKRSQGIIIDGRTYTCATCKAGHRVGICKHARERPMTATHPPGRPPAGAPKKVICDCPKQCNCKKRDCKCTRNCSCTQSMYMLVYIPAPGEEEDNRDEKGVWKLGQQVTTDLKGNILTAEQIKERQEQKEARRTQASESRSGSVTSSAVAELGVSTLPKSELKPQEAGGCCKHKENVATRNIIAQASPQSGKVSQSAADGCNCGHMCACAFCPQHPNNSTSIDMARQQAMNFANQPHGDYQQSIVSLTPTMPQHASCMGGAPRFAISTYAQRPSFQDLQRAFPRPGYVIGYPVHLSRGDSAGYPVTPFTGPSNYMSNMDMVPNNGLDGVQPPMPTPQAEMPFFGFSQDEFSIGNAFVASAGAGGWDPNLVSSSMWHTEGSSANSMANTFMDIPDYLQDTLGRSSNAPITSMHNDTSFDFGTTLLPSNDNSGFNIVAQATSMSGPPEANDNVTPSRSCCETSQQIDPYGNSWTMAPNNVP